MEDNKTLIYWLDTTGPEDFDEIVRLTIIDTNNKVLFNSTFCTVYCKIEVHNYAT